jgi:hypothetical protein
MLPAGRWSSQRYAVTHRIPDTSDAICDNVTDRMRRHTRPFVTPLSYVTGTYHKLAGSGSYIAFNGEHLLVTCEHVARLTNLEQRFYNSPTDYRVREPFILKPDPIDVAWSVVSDDMWQAAKVKAKEIPYERFAFQHSVVDQHELLFFRGFAGENAHDDLVKYITHGSGYCSQEKKEVDSSARIFEMLWDPEHTSLTSKTTRKARAAMKFRDPAGFSGSLVWNTRYMEVTKASRKWNSSHAVVTGIARRYDPVTKTLLVLRVEHLRDALERLSP